MSERGRPPSCRAAEAHARARLTCPLHLKLIGHLIPRAIRSLDRRAFMRCICEDRDCQASQITLEAWHIRWARERAKPEKRRARMARKNRRGYA